MTIHDILDAVNRRHGLSLSVNVLHSILMKINHLIEIVTKNDVIVEANKLSKTPVIIVYFGNTSIRHIESFLLSSSDVNNYRFILFGYEIVQSCADMAAIVTNFLSCNSEFRDGTIPIRVIIPSGILISNPFSNIPPDVMCGLPRIRMMYPTVKIDMLFLDGTYVEDYSYFEDDESEESEESE